MDEETPGDTRRDPRAVAINVAANTNQPGFRGPIHPDGTFEYLPIPESKPTREAVPTYADLDVETDVSSVAETPMHFDPEFPEAGGERYTYGDEHGVKARPLSELDAGDWLYFYATLGQQGEPSWWQSPRWGAYLVGAMCLARDAVTGEAYRAMEDAERAPFRTNAHVRREEFDAEVLILGDEEYSRLFERAVPLSGREAGTDANRLVTDLSSDSGKGPWWRRPMRFDEAATAELRRIVADRDLDACF
ncbi:hypothetical protein ACFPYI_11195 [Halomarina salina]|uniref:Nucleotide modification associated domain-containing protein n=1 Tax=Halomarina salina TaxID=1872699 RepID=A0ABD5RNF6_9EURY|nr:hypothetical protein [Halomarina salina]